MYEIAIVLQTENGVPQWIKSSQGLLKVSRVNALLPYFSQGDYVLFTMIEQQIIVLEKISKPLSHESASYFHQQDKTLSINTNKAVISIKENHIAMQQHGENTLEINEKHIYFKCQQSHLIDIGNDTTFKSKQLNLQAYKET
jgi:hypothetical protein